MEQEIIDVQVTVIGTRGTVTSFVDTVEETDEKPFEPFIWLPNDVDERTDILPNGDDSSWAYEIFEDDDEDLYAVVLTEERSLDSIAAYFSP